MFAHVNAEPKEYSEVLKEIFHFFREMSIIKKSTRDVPANPTEMNSLDFMSVISFVHPRPRLPVYCKSSIFQLL